MLIIHDVKSQNYGESTNIEFTHFKKVSNIVEYQ